MNIFSRLSNDDIFISYSRRDPNSLGKKYAVNLYEELKRRRFSSFMDRLGTEPSPTQPESLNHKIRNSKMLIIVGTERACQSAFVEEEIKEFLNSRRIPIVPIDFNGMIPKARWYSLIEGVTLEHESQEALSSAAPSPEIIARIEEAFQYTKRNDQLRKATIGTLGVLVVLILSSIGAAIFAGYQISAATEAKGKADEAARLANTKTEEANLATNRANSEANRANSEANRAQKQEQIANTKAEEANKATILANEKTKLAEEQTKLAEKASSEAQVAKTAAEKQQQIAQELGERNKVEQGRKLALGAQVELRKSPNAVMRAVLLATDAIKLEHSVEADDALRKGLSLLPKPVATLSQGLKIKKNSFDSTGSFAAALEVIMGDGSGGKLRIWSVNNWVLLDNISNQSGIVDYEFAPKNDCIGLLTQNGHLNIFQLSTQKLLSSELKLDHADRVIFSPNGENVAIAQSNADKSVVRVLKIDGNQQFPEIIVPGSLMDITFSDDGQLIATGSNDRFARVWQVSSGKEFSQPFNHEEEGLVSYVRFMNNSNCLISFASKIHTWLLNDKSEQSCLQTEYPTDFQPRRIMVSPTGKYIVEESQEGIIIEKWEEFGIGDKVMTIPYRNLNFIGFSQDETVFLTVGGDHTVRVWDINEGKERSRFSYDGDIIVHEVGPEIPIHSTSISPDGKLFMIGVQNINANSELEEKNLLRVFTTNGFTRQIQFDFSEVADCMALSTDSRFIASAGKDKHQQLQYVTDYSVRVRDLDTGTELANLPIDTNVKSIAFSRDGNLIAIGTDDSKVRVWNWKESTQNIKIMSHEGSGDIKSLAFSPSGLFLASAGRDNTARLWRVSNGSEAAVMRHYDVTNHSVNRVEFDRNGKYLLTASGDKTAVLWRAQDGKRIRAFKSNDWVLDARFSPDGKYVATASVDGYARLWALNSLTDKPISVMKHQRAFFSKQHNKIVNSVTFSPDGKFLATASGDWGGLWGGDMTQGEVSIWKIPNEVPITQIPHPFTVWDVEFSPDGKNIATSSSDGKLRIWNIVNGNELSRIDLLFYNIGFRKIGFSKNGKYVASPGEAYLWHTQDLINLAQSRVTRSLRQSEKDEYFLRDNSTKFNLSTKQK